MSRKDPDAPRPVNRQASVRNSMPRSVARSLGPIRPRVGTIVALALAVVATALTWADPFAEPDDDVLLVNNRTGGRRVFPTLVDADPSKATVELQAPDRPLVRIVPAANGGHQLMRGDVLLGPVAAEDFDGLWSSLRLASASRRTNTREGLKLGTRGVIRISLPDSNLTLLLGDTTAGGGVYAAFENQDEAWVVEAELLSLVEQPHDTWLSSGLVPVEPELVTGLAWGELVLGRGNDGFWRVRSGGQPAMLSSEAVDSRLRRMLRGKLDPFVERDKVPAESLLPWLVITTFDGSSRALLVGGECPGHPDRRVVDRGPGLLGCLPENLLERWPVYDPNGSMLQPRLVPHDYSRIVGIELEQPAKRELDRRGGEWFVAEDDGGLKPVAEVEVRRWYQTLGNLEVALADATALGPGEAVDGQDPSAFVPDWTLSVHADTGEVLRVSCRLAADPVLCTRDGGALLRVLGEVPRNLVFDAETFVERRLTEIGAGEIRALEILPPSEDPRSTTVRQSVHADMGTWELDAPAHPDDSGAINQDRLETLLWAVQQLRAEAWVDEPSVAPLRRITAEVVPAQGLHRSVAVTLYPDCVVEVEGHPPAAIATAQCQALSTDLLFDDPLEFWLERSRAVEIAKADGSQRVLLRRRNEQFVTDEGGPLDDEALARQIEAWMQWRSAGLREGEPPTPVAWTLDVRRDSGPSAQVEIGEGWARVKGAGWYYEQRDPKAVIEQLDAPEEEMDPGAVELD